MEREGFELLHCVQHVERVMIEVKTGATDKAWEDPSKLTAFMAQADFSVPLLVWKDIHHRDPKSWTLDAKKRAPKNTPLHETSKIMLQDHARKGLHESLTSTHGVVHNPKTPDILVYLHITEKTLLLAIPVLCRRPDPPSRRVSKGLHHSIAWGVARTANLRHGEWVLDPCVGKAGLVLESEAWWPGCTYCGVDNDIEQLKHAYENAEVNKSNVSLIHGSCTTLPFRACFDVAISDLPFGRSCGTPEGNKTLYPSLLRSLHRALNASGRLVLLTGEESAETLGTALKETGFLTLGTVVFHFGGNKNKLQCYMYLAVKDTHPLQGDSEALRSLFDWRFAEKLKQNKEHSWRNEKPSMTPYRAKANACPPPLPLHGLKPFNSTRHCFILFFLLQASP
eukprot:TRINITY_DN9154_c0_g2_i2.p1 TRINITY_DN9154_c0_g2~~TRINITY_DN9154_c0_g2_i2.p1  ORF type:complete len:428 (+),score=93.68 TRINITY_DN9154_c0_g2_i2:101-1285(+)